MSTDTGQDTAPTIPMTEELLAAFQTDSQKCLLSIAQAHPDEGLLRLAFPTHVMHYVASPGLAHEVLVKNPAAFLRSQRFMSMAPVTGTGVIMTDGERWRYLRDTSNGAFSQAQIHRMSGILHEVLDEIEPIDERRPEVLAVGAKLPQVRRHLGASAFQ